MKNKRENIIFCNDFSADNYTNTKHNLVRAHSYYLLYPQETLLSDHLILLFFTLESYISITLILKDEALSQFYALNLRLSGI